LKILLKGIDSGEDVRLARESGADGLIISNHGGRSTETLRATIDSLPEVIDAVGHEFPVLVDGGVRRGAENGCLNWEHGNRSHASHRR
jgi:4-hydroxymandelate oxidase